MRMGKLAVWAYTLHFLLFLVPGISAAGTGNAASAQQFVQNFYDQYLSLVGSNNQGDPWTLEVKANASEFSSQLAQSLEEDAAAQAATPDEIVGLDFDPFLQTQDPANRYLADAAIQKGDSFWVPIRGVWGKHPSPRSDVAAELTVLNGNWILTNFHYSDGDDLLALLARLKKDRDAPKK